MSKSREAADADAGNSTPLISLPVPICAALVAAVDEVGNCSTALANARDAVLHEFADAGLNRAGQPVAEDGADVIGGYGTVPAADADPAAKPRTRR